MTAATNRPVAGPLADGAKTFVFYAVWLALLWIAFGERHPGAVNVLLFCLWCLSLLSPFALADSSIMSAARRRPRPLVWRWTVKLISWSTLALLVWHGHFWTAGAWAIAMVLLAVGGDMVRKERAKLAGDAS